MNKLETGATCQKTACLSTSSCRLSPCSREDACLAALSAAPRRTAEPTTDTAAPSTTAQRRDERAAALQRVLTYLCTAGPRPAVSLRAKPSGAAAAALTESRRRIGSRPAADRPCCPGSRSDNWHADRPRQSWAHSRVTDPACHTRSVNPTAAAAQEMWLAHGAPQIQLRTRVCQICADLWSGQVDSKKIYRTIDPQKRSLSYKPHHWCSVILRVCAVLCSALSMMST